MSFMKLEINFIKANSKSASAFPLPNTEYTPLYLNAENHTLNHAKD
ncbi:CocE/NonD family hydrolase [Staphylococcus aureus]|uniref:CocE/NonD family hydrolase n=1 Tax=Staphylococcus aureus TaxID=1280 RepID=A0A380DXD6_STAAU|nr:CocE/NonD family hydrolase [Staphylococcus aureus]